MIQPTLAPHLIDYAVNTLWQLPLLAASTWLLIRLCRPSVFVQHLLWIATLGLAATLPLRHPAIPITSAPQPTLLSLHGLITASPLPLSGLSHPRSISLAPVLLTTLVRLWLLALAINLLRLTSAWISSRRLIASATTNPEALDPAFLQSCADRLHIPIPDVRFLNSPSATPVVAGIFHPILLLPAHLAHDYELTAILLHEFAHIRRRDTLTNALCRLIALPIAWHPVTPLLHARINQTREILCDTLAAEAAGSPNAYARSLLTLARNLKASQPARNLATLGIFPSTRTSSAMEERIMNLITPASPKLSNRAIRISAGVALVVAATLTTAAFHLQPASAAQRPTVAASVVPVYSKAPTADWKLSDQPSTTLKPYAPTPYTSRDNGATWQAVIPTRPHQEPFASPEPSTPPAALPALSARPAPPPIASHAPSPALPPIGLLAPQTPSPAPAPTPAPPAPIQTPEPKPTQQSRIIVEGQERDLTPAEQADLDKQLANVNAQVKAAIANIHPDLSQLNQQLKHLHSPEFHRQMADLQRQLANAEFQKQIAEASRIATDQAINSDALREQVAHASAEMAKAQSNIVKQNFTIQFDPANLQAQIKAATEALAHMKIPTGIHIDIDSATLQRQLDQAQHQIDEARKHLKETTPQP